MEILRPSKALTLSEFNVVLVVLPHNAEPEVVKDSKDDLQDDGDGIAYSNTLQLCEPFFMVGWLVSSRKGRDDKPVDIGPPISDRTFQVLAGHWALGKKGIAHYLFPPLNPLKARPSHL
ncbi:hypothetical protein PanWU01x14_105580 [Parasponia andersonii]|uniref:Uncharacterized protein n=1 Tax=Parasponia andersonii TaxID=3476 RepID=A0A2P5D107_PARAD|nr:hypothetical protein PanWU01x14_105580 [Parasponia andersonii]